MKISEVHTLLRRSIKPPPFILLDARKKEKLRKAKFASAMIAGKENNAKSLACSPAKIQLKDIPSRMQKLYILACARLVSIQT